MKKIFFFTFSLLVTSFAYQSCKPVDNTKAMMQSDSIADSKLMMLSDSLHMACMTDVMNAAKMKADSMMMAMQSHGKGSKAAPPAPPPPAKSGGKLSDKMNEQPDGKLKDKMGSTDTTKKKLKDKMNPPK